MEYQNDQLPISFKHFDPSSAFFSYIFFPFPAQRSCLPSHLKKKIIIVNNSITRFENVNGWPYHVTVFLSVKSMSSNLVVYWKQTMEDLCIVMYLCNAAYPESSEPKL